MADEKLYHYRYKGFTVGVRAENAKQARYRAELAFHTFRTTGKKPSNATIEANDRK